MKSHLGIDQALIYVNKHEKKINSVLDFGCGKGGLMQLLKEIPNSSTMKIDGYDPCLKQFSKKPIQKYDLVTCVDVLEHIDRENIANTLREINNFASGIFFYIIDMTPAIKNLEDGRNAHILLAPPDWWCQQITSIFQMNISFTLGQMPDGINYPIRLVGCASNNNALFSQASQFIYGTGLSMQKWIWEKNKANKTNIIRIKSLN
ncbi:class I SAM-dependent methyltransferase [Synechococcus sp. AH-551-A10]|nr:methyltransferase domain-containing protein [Synechococcus sp. AH-551-A10]MDB4682116.1 class I SAM-dependent methyltransferase [Synechococcus sp. AH-551-A10]